MAQVDRRTVDLSAYPDLVVIYLGMRVNAFCRPEAPAGTGPANRRLRQSQARRPAAARRPSLLAVSRCTPACASTGAISNRWSAGPAPSRTANGGRHFLRDSGGTGFWHETYALRGGIEAIYDDMPQPIGMMKFAPLQPARGSSFLRAPAAQPRRLREFARARARSRLCIATSPPTGSDGRASCNSSASSTDVTVTSRSRSRPSARS